MRTEPPGTGRGNATHLLRGSMVGRDVRRAERCAGVSRRCVRAPTMGASSCARDRAPALRGEWAGRTCVWRLRARPGRKCHTNHSSVQIFLTGTHTDFIFSPRPRTPHPLFARPETSLVRAVAPAASRIVARAHLPRVDDAESSRDVHRAHDLAHSSGRASPPRRPPPRVRRAAPRRARVVANGRRRSAR